MEYSNNLAFFLKRVSAWLVDRFVLFILLILYIVNTQYGHYILPAKIGAVTGSFGSSYNFALEFQKTNLYDIYSNYMLFLQFVFIIVLITRLYYFFCEIIWGATIGKKIFNIEIISVNETSKRIITSLKRTFSYWILYCVIFCFILLAFRDLNKYYLILFNSN